MELNSDSLRMNEGFAPVCPFVTEDDKKIDIVAFIITSSTPTTKIRISLSLSLLRSLEDILISIPQ